MDNTNLIFIGGSFVVVVVLFIFALFKFVLSNKPAKEREISIDLANGPSLESVKMILDSRSSTLQDLQEAMDKVFEEYDKLNPDKREIKNMLVGLSLHPNAEKNIILDTQKKFTEKHPDLAMEFERAVKKGLDSRGWSKK